MCQNSLQNIFRTYHCRARPLETSKKLCQVVQYLEILVKMKPLCRSIFPFEKTLNYCNMSRFMSVSSDFYVFDPKSPVCCCLGWFEEPDIEILGIPTKFKRPPFICVKPRQANFGVNG